MTEQEFQELLHNLCVTQGLSESKSRLAATWVLDRGIPMEVGARAADLKRPVAEIAKRAGDVTVSTAADEVAAACDAILPANGPLRRV